MSKILHCPRCNEKAFEKLSTHSYCLCCGYTPDLIGYRVKQEDNSIIPNWALKALSKSNYQETPKISLKQKGS